MSSPDLKNVHCLVCGDNVKCNNFGIPACLACAAFFRKSIVEAKVYKCRHQKNCIIGLTKRNSCRHCRLKKCLRFGMDKELVKNRKQRWQQKETNVEMQMGESIKNVKGERKQRQNKILKRGKDKKNKTTQKVQNNNINIDEINNKNDEEKKLMDLNDWIGIAWCLGEMRKRMGHRPYSRRNGVDCGDRLMMNNVERNEIGLGIVQNLIAIIESKNAGNARDDEYYEKMMNFFEKGTNFGKKIWHLDQLMFLGLMKTMPFFRKMTTDDQEKLSVYVCMAAILFINAYFSVQVEGRTTLASLTTLCQSQLSFNEHCPFPEKLSAVNASNCAHIDLLRIMERNFPCKEEFALTLGLILTHFSSSGLSPEGRAVLLVEARNIGTILMRIQQEKFGIFQASSRYMETMDLISSAFEAANAQEKAEIYADLCAPMECKEMLPVHAEAQHRLAGICAEIAQSFTGNVENNLCYDQNNASAQTNAETEKDNNNVNVNTILESEVTNGTGTDTDNINTCQYGESWNWEQQPILDNDYTYFWDVEPSWDWAMMI